MSIADKIRKLLALAEGSSFPEESASALAKAQRLMTENDIALADIDTLTEEPEEPIERFNAPLNEEDSNSSRAQHWKLTLSYYLAQHNGCKTFYRGASIYLIGRQSDADKVRYLFSYAAREINRLTDLHCKGKGKTYRNNFRYGCIDSIRSALKAEVQAMKQEHASDSRALVIINRPAVRAEEAGQWADKNMSLKSGQSTRHRYDSSGRGHGQEAGRGIMSGSCNSLSAPQKRIGS